MMPVMPSALILWVVFNLKVCIGVLIANQVRVDEAFERIGLLRALPSEARQGVVCASRLQSVEKNKTHFRCGSATTSFSFVIRGRLRLTHTMATGRHLDLKMVGPGELACSPAVCMEQAYCCDAVAAEPNTLVLVVPKRALFCALFGDSPAALELIGFMSAGAMAMCERLVELGGRAVDKRVAALFLRLSRQHGVRRADSSLVHLPLALSRREVAQLCGTTDETASRTMMSLEREGVVVLERDGFCVDEETLERRTKGLAH